MSERIFDDDGLRVTPKNRGRHLSVEVTVIGGEWSIGRATAERLHAALTKWLDTPQPDRSPVGNWLEIPDCD
jgi:hypothetical protein